MGSRLLARLSAAVIATAGLVLLVAGCAAPTGPEVLTVSSDQYAAVFEAAVEAARSNRMPPVLRDPRAGVIETAAPMSPSLLEPWYQDGSTLGQRVENTLAAQRRRARFEFTPAGFQPPTEQAEPLTGPDLLALEHPLPDLTQFDGDVELRVWVYVERAAYPGLRRSTWTRSKPTTATIIRPDGQALPSRYWTPISRDRNFERRLLAAIRKRAPVEAATPQ